MKKIPARYTGYVFSFWMALLMACLMSAAITAINTGIADGFVWRWLHAYLAAFPIALIAINVVRPVVMKLVSVCVEPVSQ